MIQKIRVKTNSGKDIQAEGTKTEINRLLNGNVSIKKVEIVKVYRIDGISKSEAQILAEKLFCESINQEYSLNQRLLEKANTVFEISYRPGVMNPEVGSIIKAAKDLGIHLTDVSSSKEYGFYGDVSREDLEQIILRLNVLNPVIEYIRPQDDPITIIPIKIMTDEELLMLSQDTLFLNRQELKIIQKYFRKLKRNPTDCELETIAQTWSEHCTHKTFKAKLVINGKQKQPLFSRIKKEALKHKKHIVSAFVDNSGAMSFFEDWAICGKVETHNSPSAIEPYGGAMTGSGGVFRDILGTGQGAKNIASTDIFCFAGPSLDAKKLPLGTLPPEYLLKKVVSGVRDYGNRMGIPTNNGSVHFHNDFRAKPTVIVGAYGILPLKRAKKGQPKFGDLIVVVGGRTGRDGIHGATFASGEMTERTISVNAQAVQIGNAIEEKRMFDAILEARDKNLIRTLQDCGAGGFSSAIGEMGEKTGASVHLEKAPVKYEGLLPWEIWISESQERMILAVSKNNINKLKGICKKYNVEISVLGTFDGSKRLQVFYEGERVCDLDMKFLHHGLPQRKMTARKPSRHPEGATRLKDLRSRSFANAQDDIPYPKTEKSWIKIFKKILSHGNICSKEPIVRLYDHSVQGMNALAPFTGEYMDGPNDAVVLRPFLNKQYGIVVSHGLNPILNKIDPYWGSIWAATEALANYVAVGGNYKEASLINNYIWPFPDEESLWSLDQSVDAVVDVMKALKIPVISGKDSLSSTYRGADGTIIKIPPVLCISVFGKIPDVTKTVTSDFKKDGSVICLVGKMDWNAMGGSTYLDVLKTPPRWPNGLLGGGRVPRIDLKLLPKVLSTLHSAIQTGKILSCHDVSEGGLLTSVFEMCVGGDIGAFINTSEVVLRHSQTWQGSLTSRPRHTSEVKVRSDFFLFNETAGCFVVEVENQKTAKQIFKGAPYTVLGTTQKKKQISVKNGERTLFSAGLSELKKSWQEPMKRYFN